MRNFNRIFTWFTFVIFLISYTGCGGGDDNTDNTDTATTITLELGGFPYDYNSYDLLVSSVFINPDSSVFINPENENYEILDTYTFNVNGSSRSAKFQIDINNKATDINVYLLANESETPIFCWGFPFDPDQVTYKSNYWLYYNPFVPEGIIRFGISESLAKLVTTGVNEAIDFRNGYYFLYKLLNVNQRTIRVETEVSQGSVAIKTGASLAELAADPSQAEGGIQTKEINSNYDSLYILLESGSYDEKGPITQATVSISIVDAEFRSVSGQPVLQSYPVHVPEVRIPKLPSYVMPYPKK